MIDVTPFIETAGRKLAPYLYGVESFLAELGSAGKMEPTALRSRRPEEYIRNILTVGILNRLHRSAFLGTKRRVIVLPECLKAYSGQTCGRIDEGNAKSCTQCNVDCLVFETVERYANDYTRVVLEPENLGRFFEDIIAPSDPVGVVGVACVLTLLSGFETTIKYRLPTQGIFLNYAGCDHHWMKPGINTSFSFRRMASILGDGRNDEPDPGHDRGPTYSLEKAPLSPDDFYRCLDEISREFEKHWLPQFIRFFGHDDIFGLSLEIRRIIVPDLISRDSA